MSLLAQPVAHPLQLQGGQLDELVHQLGQEHGAGRRRQLPAGPAVDRDAAQQLRGRRRRHRQLAVRRLHPAAADVDRAAGEPLRRQVLDRRRGAHQVDDRVDRPDLVEVHAVDRHAVHLGLRLAQPLEEPARPLLHRSAPDALSPISSRIYGEVPAVAMW